MQVASERQDVRTKNVNRIARESASYSY